MTTYERVTPGDGTCYLCDQPATWLELYEGCPFCNGECGNGADAMFLCEDCMAPEEIPAPTVEVKQPGSDTWQDVSGQVRSISFE